MNRWYKYCFVCLIFGIVNSHDNFYTSCGITSTCFGIKKGNENTPNPELAQCRSGECIASLVLMPPVKHAHGNMDQNFHFHMRIDIKDKPSYYAAVGINRKVDVKMNKMLILECVKESDKISSYVTWNKDTPYNPAIAPVRVYSSLPQSSKLNRWPDNLNISNPELDQGSLYCNFFLPKKFILNLPLPSTEKVQIDLEHEQYEHHLSIVVGSIQESVCPTKVETNPEYEYPGVPICRHSAVGVTDPLSLMVIQNKVVTKSFVLHRFHAFFMVLTYFTLMPIATIIARYFRETWSTRQVCKKRLWFSIHAGLLYGALGLTIVGYTCMAIGESEAWPEGEPGKKLSGGQIHASIGMTSIALLFTQTILPWVIHIPSKNLNLKKIYSVIHAVVGSVCYCLGLLNIILVPILMPEKGSCNIIFITFIWLGCHFCMYWLMTTLLIIKDHQMANNNARFRALLSYPIRLKTMDDAPGKTKRIIFLGVLIAMSLTMTIVMGIQVFEGGQCKLYEKNASVTK